MDHIFSSLDLQYNYTEESSPSNNEHTLLPLKIKQEFNKIDVEAEFNNTLNLLIGNSGTGKTLLLKATALFCQNHSIKYFHGDYHLQGNTFSEIISKCNNCEVVLFDNADLYLTDEIVQHILNQGSIIIFSMKDTFDISMAESSQFLSEYNNLQVRIKEI